MWNPRSLPGVVQLLLAVAVIAVFTVMARALGVPHGWEVVAGAFFGSLAIVLWEAVANRD